MVVLDTFNISGIPQQDLEKYILEKDYSWTICFQILCRLDSCL